VLFPLLVGVTVWVKMGRKLRTMVAVGGLTFILIAIPSVRYLRALGAYESLTAADITKSIERAHVSDVFVELGATSGIVAYVMKWVPAEEAYRYGRTYVKAIANSIPNFGFSKGVSDRSEIKGTHASRNDLLSLSASDWFIYRYNAWMFRTGGGSGFSAVAEPYLNFGVPGVVVVFFFIGLFVGKLDAVRIAYNPTVFLLSCVMLWPLMKTVRNDFTAFLKPVLFQLIILAIWKLATLWKRHRTDVVVSSR